MSIFRRTKHSVIALVAVMAINGFSQSSVTFNVDGASTVVPPSIYGVLMEILGRQFKNNGIYVGTSSSVPNTDGIRKDIIEGFKECGVTCAQWPGGCAAKGFDWSENKRKDFGVDRFIEFCKLCEMEPFIVGDAGNAPSNLAFMKYVIDSLKYPLKWFKVGNEVWDCGGKYNANSYSTQYSSNYDRLGSYAKEKNVKLIASISYGGGDDWINTLLNNNSGKIDGFEIHQYIYHPDDYSSTDPSTQQYWDVINLAYNGQIRSNLKRIVGTLNSKDPQNKVKIYFDEWGDWFKDLGDAWEQRITVLDALSAGEHLHAFMEYSNRFEMAGLAQAVNVIHSLMNINQSSGVMSKTTTFYVFKMYIPHHTNNAMQVPITAENWKKVNNNVQAVTSFASVDKDGIVSISFTNADISATQAVTVNLTSKIESYSVKSAEVITGPAINSYNEYGKDETVNIKPLSSSSYSLSGKTLNVTLPSKSVVMIRLQPPTGIQSENIIKNDVRSFSVNNGANGSVFVTSALSHSSPVTVSLYGIDGRTLISNVSTKFDNGNSVCISGNKALSKGTYLVKIKGENLNLTKQVVISR